MLDRELLHPVQYLWGKKKITLKWKKCVCIEIQTENSGHNHTLSLKCMYTASHSCPRCGSRLALTQSMQLFAAAWSTLALSRVWQVTSSVNLQLLQLSSPSALITSAHTHAHNLKERKSEKHERICKCETLNRAAADHHVPPSIKLLIYFYSSTTNPEVL